MYSSFLASKSADEEATEKAKKELDEVKLLVEKQEALYNDLSSSAQRYSDMITDLVALFPSLVEGTTNNSLPALIKPQDEEQENKPFDIVLAQPTIDLHKNKRLHYPVKLTDKLRELLAACGIVQTDEEMTLRLQKSLGMPVPFKTAQNKLWELGKDGRTKRVRAGASFINGLPEWFEGYRVKPQHAPTKEENKTAPALAGAE